MDIFVDIAVTIFVNIAYIHFFIRKERRLYKNINRPILLLEASEGGLRREERIINGTKLLRVGERVNYCLDPDVVIGEFNERAIVIEYKNDENFNDLFNKARNNHTPIVVFSRPDEIDDREMLNKMHKYAYCSIANTPTRLLSDLFALMNVMPECK